MAETLFTALVVSSALCATGEPMTINGCHDGKPPSVVEMRVLGGRNCELRPDHFEACGNSVDTLLQITVDGKTVLIVPAIEAQGEIVKRLWDAMMPLTGGR